MPKFVSDILAKAGLTVDGVVTLNNTATGQTPDSNDNSTKLATTAWVRTFVQPYSLPIASNTVLGGIKVGDGLSIDGSGVLSTSGGGGGNVNFRTVEEFTATAGQTVFTLANGYTVGYVEVLINGVYISESQYTANDETTIVLTDPAGLNDVVTVFLYSLYNLGQSSYVRNTDTLIATAGQTIFTTSYIPGQVDIYYNGSKLSTPEYTATTGSTIVLTQAAALGDVLEVITYLAGAGLNSNRSITINGVTYDLSSDRTWSITSASLGAQAQLNGTGFVKISGTTISYDNSTYLTSITSSNVTTALGYTPYNNTNPSGYITSSALSSYLALSGGILTGTLSGTSATFSDVLYSTKTTGRSFGNDSYGTNFGWIAMYGTSQGIQLGFEGIIGGQLVTGAGANYGILVGKTGLAISANNGGTNHLNITSTGIATFSSSVTSSRFTSTTGDAVFFNAATGGSQWQLGSDSSAGSGMYLWNSGGAGYVFRLTATGAGSFSSSLSVGGAITVGSIDGLGLRLQAATSTGNSYLRFYNSTGGAEGYLGLFNAASTNYLLVDASSRNLYLNGSASVFLQTAGTDRMRVTSSSIDKYDYNTAVWSPLQNTIIATGGSISTITSNGATYKIHTYTSTSTFTVYGYGLVEILVIGGGGGGGWDVGGGGGAGGYVETSTFVIPGTYTITVGGGAGGSGSGGGQAASGGQSTALGIIALGGGGGANYSFGTGANGANGGGGAGYSGGPLAGGAGTFRQGNAGGTGRSDLYSLNATGAGGGGAAAPGAQSSNDISGYALGGAGVVSWITGSNSTYCKGGAGGGDNWTGHQDGATNTGNGGDGAGNPNNGKNGGSGIVIIRYKV